MASSTQTISRLTTLWETPKTVYGWFATVDHKTLGIRYLVTAFSFLVIGGLEALVMRLQLTRSDMAVLTPEEYNQIFTLHGVTMIFWYASPILSGFAVFLVPLMIGARDMAFPRLNAFTYWTFLLSGILLYVSPLIGQAPHAGWFSYVPYTLTKYSPGMGMDFYAASLVLLTISTTGGAINFIVTILRLRAPGMAISRMPLFLYSTGTISFVILFSLPSLTANCIFLELDRRWGTHFFRIAGGGDTFLWQQLFWFFGHPWVYVIFLPATGMLSMIVPVFSRRPIVGYPFVAIATVLTGVVGFGVWLHHMFTVGMSDIAMSIFSAGSMTVSVFTTIQVFAWLATIWRGRPVATASMYYAVGSIVLLVIGGLSGVFTGVIPADWQAHNSYFVVAHIHYVLIGSNMFPVFAGFYYWLPKMMGRRMNEKLGKISFWVMFIGFNLGFFPMHNLGLLGMPRRIYTYPAGAGFDGLNELVTFGAFVLGIGILISIINFFHSLRAGAPAGENPWNADTLEWSTTSPPQVYGSEHIPVVVSRHPLWDEFEEEDDPDDDRVLDWGRLTPTTTALDAIPAGIATIPADSLAPLWMSLALFAFFLFVIYQMLWWMVASVIVTFLVGCYWMWPHVEKEVVE
ncbi:cytochrome c oxidase subunit I [Occallatibacter riparius]|uniref:Cbb3-type cytochrome c oxidase subunit I n=1 Tax=Occallatibacter riparius TaxID=1002689 RepID=A0A9J7BUY0_9BACT|nr:cbb3-type cytochrome c oxidase subunit I [Occallatibacter riparius]UWZ86683.1 cbb3-type cytochrome c oxidase subunit I [Occallatibacter riparius]